MCSFVPQRLTRSRWVIEAYHRDLPYDTFVKAQIASDLMAGDFPMGLRPALGFLGLGHWYFFFLNSEIVEHRAAALGARFSKTGSIREIYLLLFNREPKLHEIELGERFLKTADWKQYAQVLFSSNEFSFID